MTETGNVERPKINIKLTVFDYVYLLLVSGALIALDQWTKSLVRANIPIGSDYVPDWLAWLAPFARIRHWHNSGAAFGLFQDGNLVFTVLAILVSLGIIYYFPRAERNIWWMRLALAMQLAGAVGNLLDRLQFGRVTDFISVGNFAVFNVADSCISVGVAILVIGLTWLEWKQKKQAKEEVPDERQD